MNLLRLFVMIACLASAAPVLAHSPTEECGESSAMAAVNCLQPRLDSRIALADRIFGEILVSVSDLSREAPGAGIDPGSVVGELRIAKEKWEEFASHECAAAREWVGTGTDKNTVEMVCLIQLYDQRIAELEAWRSL